MAYIPKLHHAVITTFILILFIALAGMTRGSVSKAFVAGAFVMALMTAVVMALLWMEGRNESTRVMIDWMTAFSKLDEEARSAVAFQFPSMRYRMKRGQVRPYFEDTSVTIEQFRLFLQTSNDRYISPERDWSGGEMPRWAWTEIKGWLEENDYILPDSAAGSHSWLWKGNAYRHLLAYWMAGRQIVDMGEGERVYAYEE